MEAEIEAVHNKFFFFSKQEQSSLIEKRYKRSKKERKHKIQVKNTPSGCSNI
jgi:hypothetical protein